MRGRLNSVASRNYIANLLGLDALSRKRERHKMCAGAENAAELGGLGEIKLLRFQTE